MIDARDRPDHQSGHQKIAVRTDIGAGVGDEVQAQADELVVGVERQFDIADAVARMFVGEHGFRTFAGPFDGAAELLRGPQDEAVLDILPALGAEAAADIAGHDPDLALGHAKHGISQHLADAMRILAVRIERVMVLGRVIDAERAAWLHILRVDA